jgi:hypothetical protein
VRIGLEKDHRLFYRLTAEVPVSFRFVAPGEPPGEWAKGVTENLSKGGFLLQGTLPRMDMMGDLLTGRVPVGVMLTLPDGQEPVCALARVAWIESLDVDTGHCRMGMRYQELTVADQDRVLSFVIQYGIRP